MRYWLNEETEQRADHYASYAIDSNGIELKYTQKELYKTILDVAAGNIDYEGLLLLIIINYIIYDDRLVKNC